VGGVYALIGATGVGKTTSTAKLAAAFATKHGAANLGLITLDAYRVARARTTAHLRPHPGRAGAHRARPRLAGRPAGPAVGQAMVLIDTAGMAQRDSRTANCWRCFRTARSAACWWSTLGRRARPSRTSCGLPRRRLPRRGAVQAGRAVKLGPALDAMIRHKLKVLAVANGQRVPEDWHRLSANALVQRALRSGGPAWRWTKAT
jgi:flagellar biosynthesis protein FlhF